MRENAIEANESRDGEAVNSAIALLHQGKLLEAEDLLLAVIANTPPDYYHEISFENGSRRIKFWSSSDFIYFISCLTEAELATEIVWIPNAYPRAFFYLGFIAVEKNDLESALAYLEAGLGLEPEQPEFLVELAKVYTLSGDYDKAMSLYTTVIEKGPEVTPIPRAIAYRAMGYRYTELGNLEEALRCYLESLLLEPNNELALHELHYIQYLLMGGAETSSRAFWSTDTNICAKVDIPHKKWWQFWK